MVPCPGALPFLGTNLTMFMCSLGQHQLRTGGYRFCHGHRHWLSNMYGLVSTNWLISPRFVSSKSLKIDPKVPFHSLGKKLCFVCTDNGNIA